MIKPVLDSLVTQIAAAVALGVCLSVAAVAGALGLHEALRLVMPGYLASGILAVVFLLISAGIVAWLHHIQQRKPQEAPPKFGLRLLRDLAMAGAVTFISAAGVRPRR